MQNNILATSQKITPFLWFDNNVEEAINFYTSIFKNSKIGRITRLPDGTTVTGTFHIANEDIFALNGGSLYKFTPAVSFYVNCETAEETDELWKNLAEGGSVLMPLDKYPFSEKYGWVQDKFGLSWQLNFTGAKQKIVPSLMFVNDQQGKAEEAINFYKSLFKNSATLRLAHYEAGEGGAEGTLKHGAFSLDGQEFIAMDSNWPHNFNFTPAISFFVICHTQEEVDFFWEKLSDGGKEDRCGWLVDRYGVSWQIAPTVLTELMGDPDPVKSKRVMDAMMKMGKIEIQKLQEAYNNDNIIEKGQDTA